MHYKTAAAIRKLASQIAGKYLRKSADADIPAGSRPMTGSEYIDYIQGLNKRKRNSGINPQVDQKSGSTTVRPPSLRSRWPSTKKPSKSVRPPRTWDDLLKEYNPRKLPDWSPSRSKYPMPSLGVNDPDIIDIRKYPMPSLGVSGDSDFPTRYPSAYARGWRRYQTDYQGPRFSRMSDRYAGELRRRAFSDEV